MTSRYLHNLPPVRADQADGAQKEVLDIARKQVGFIPNMYANMAQAPAVLSSYLHGYSRLPSRRWCFLPSVRSTGAATARLRTA
jgi:hypothetical protein